MTSAMENSTVIPKQLKTIAEVLRKKGYRTIGATDGGYVHGKFVFSRGFSIYRDKERYGIKNTLEYLKSKIKPGKRPYFIFLHTYDIHAPYGGQDIPPYTNENYNVK